MRKVLIPALLLVACSPLAQLGLDPRPASIDEPIDRSTHGRLMRSTADPAACLAWLNQAGAAFTPVADRQEGEFCSVAGAGNLGEDLRGEALRFSPRRPMMTCPLAAALSVWRMQSVQPLAQALLGSPVTQIDHLGVYACRRIYGQETGPPSGHASANAIDIAGFVLADGRRISVEKDWGKDSPEGRFLAAVRDGACATAGEVLSPDYNAAHANHLHVEVRPWRMCG